VFQKGFWKCTSHRLILFKSFQEEILTMLVFISLSLEKVGAGLAIIPKGFILFILK